MRTFLVATAATLAIGYGSLFALSASSHEAVGGGMAVTAQPAAATLAPASDVKAVEEGKFVSRDLAFQRLALEAQLEEFYARLAAEAEGMSEAERVELYREAEAELARMILGSSTYSGPNLSKGKDYLALARLVLARHLGFESVPV